MASSAHHLRALRDHERAAAELLALVDPPTSEIAWVRGRIEGHAIRAIVEGLTELREEERDGE